MRINDFTQDDCKYYIYDLLRLASIRRNKSDSTRAFFMLVGRTEQIKEELKCKKDEDKRIDIKPQRADEIKEKKFVCT